MTDPKLVLVMDSAGNVLASASSLDKEPSISLSHPNETNFNFITRQRPEPGSITVVEGAMGSGKTVYLVRYVETYGRFAPVLFINHSIDNRDGDDAPVSSRSSLVNSASIKKLRATYVKVSKLADVDPSQLASHSVVIIDEGQFFPDLTQKVLEFAEVLGKRVVVAGLLSDYARKPFGQMLNLILYADLHHKLSESLCEDCLDRGKATMSLFTRSLVKMDGQIRVGKDDFRGCCRECWLKFGGEPM